MTISLLDYGNSTAKDSHLDPCLRKFNFVKNEALILHCVRWSPVLVWPAESGVNISPLAPNVVLMRM